MSSGLQTQRGGGNCHVSASLPASNPRTPFQARRSTECAYKQQGVAQVVAFPLGWAGPAACPCALQGVHTEARLSRHSAARAPVAAGEVLHPEQQRHAGLEDTALHPQSCGWLHPGARRWRRGAIPGEVCCGGWGARLALSQPLGHSVWLPLTLMPLTGVSAPRTQDWQAWAHGTRRGFLYRELGLGRQKKFMMAFL